MVIAIRSVSHLYDLALCSKILVPRALNFWRSSTKRQVSSIIQYCRFAKKFLGCDSETALTIYFLAEVKVFESLFPETCLDAECLFSIEVVKKCLVATSDAGLK